ncbi:hypothetical protein [Gordonibacter urolithinfaciens]|uniref:hypothetical protein n=1 Tax=Gordonibacter urolithinfaciens TaxID=1335613 RepID=UPI003A92C03A
MDPRLFSLVVIVGYGLFRGVNANSYLSAFASVEAPFLFVPDLFFNVVVACSVVVCSVTVIALVLRGRLGPLSMPYVAPAALFVAANLCALFGVFSWMPSDLALIVPGVLLGAASVMLSLVWVEVLACQEPRAIVTQIALSMLVNMVTSSVLSGLSGGARAAASCAALVVMVLCARYVRRALRTGAAGARAGGAVVTMAVGKGAAGDCAGKAARGHLKAAPRGSYRDAFLELGDSLVAFCVMEAVIGLLNSFMLAGSVTFAGSGSVSGVGMLIGILAFCVVVFVVQRIPRVSTAFRVLMPIIASLLVFLPFLGEQFNLFFSTVLLGGYYFIALLITYVVAETAHVRNLSPYVLMGGGRVPCARLPGRGALGRVRHRLAAGRPVRRERAPHALPGGHHGRDLRAVAGGRARAARPAPPTARRCGCGGLGFGAGGCGRGGACPGHRGGRGR